MPDDELSILVNLFQRLITKTAIQSSSIVPNPRQLMTAKIKKAYEILKTNATRH